MRKKLLIPLLVVVLSTVGVAAQPKILEVTDNLGHTFNFKNETATGGSARAFFGDTSGGSYVYDQLQVTDDTKITLCVTKVSADNKVDLQYYYYYISEGAVVGVHPDDVYSDEQTTSDNCNTWHLNTSHYKADWRFTIGVTNGDDINYHTDENTDYKASISYKNLTMAGESSDSNEYNYDNIKLSRTEYQELKGATLGKNQKAVNIPLWNKKNKQIKNLENKTQKLQTQVKQKQQRIQKLEGKIDTLQETVSSLQNTIQQLNNTLTANKQKRQEQKEEETGIVGFITSLFS